MKAVVGSAGVLALVVIGGWVWPRAPEALPFYQTSERTPEWISRSSPRYSHIHRVGRFDLVDQSGHHITQDTVAGKIYVASFFFTECRQLCPRLQSNLSQLQRRFASDADVLILSHSVSPDRDDTAALRRYARVNGVRAEKWHLLTGDPQQIDRLARSAYFAQLPDSISGVPTPLLHSETLVLVDRLGRIRGLYDGSLQYETDRLIDDVAALLAGSPQARR